MSTIERFTGYQVPVGAFPGLPDGYYGLPGGGIRGLTDELDALVMEAAERLRTQVGADIQVRYNSDRKSGGAYLMPESKYGTIGVNAGLYPPSREDLGMTIDQWLDRVMTPEGKAWAKSLPLHLEIHTYVHVGVLRDPSLADQGSSIGQPYSYRKHDSLDAAFAWFRENVVLP